MPHILAELPPGLPPQEAAGIRAARTVLLPTGLAITFGCTPLRAQAVELATAAHRREATELNPDTELPVEHRPIVGRSR